MAIPTRAELDGLIRDRLSNDPNFRDTLLADPRAAVAELLNIKLPDSVTVEVHQESLSHLHLLLPAKTSAGELSDDDLEQVAGGTCWTNCGDYGP